MIGLDFTGASFLLRSATGFFFTVAVDVWDDAVDANDDVDAGEFVKRILPFSVLRVVALVCRSEADVCAVVEEVADVIIDLSCFRITGVWSGVIGNTGVVVLGLAGNVSNEDKEVED